MEGIGSVQCCAEQYFKTVFHFALNFDSFIELQLNSAVYIVTTDYRLN